MNHIIGTPLRWTITTYDGDGEPIDADGLPSVSLRINQATTAQSVSVTKRTAETGIYDASATLAGLAEGDHIEALAIVEIDTTSYQHAYQWRAVAPATVDSAGVTALLARITARLRTAAEADAADQAILDEIASLAPDTGPDVRTLKIVSHTGDDPETGEPVSGLQLRIAGRTLTTDTAGLAEIRLNPGDYVAPVIEPIGFEPVAPLEITIGAEDAVVPIPLTRTSAGTIAPAGMCAVTLRLKSQSGRPLSGVPVAYRLATGFATVADEWLLNDEPGAPTDAFGDATVIVPRNQICEFAAILGPEQKDRVTLKRRVPDAASATLSMLIPVQ